MADPRFHVPELSGPVVRLAGHEARHACQARRLRQGDAVVLFDGNGREARGEILKLSGAEVQVHVSEVHSCMRPRPALTLAVAVPKGPRQDFMIEKCTELGVAAIWPILTARSVCSVSEHRLDKWRRTTIEAAKQSEQCWLPELGPPRRLEDVLADVPGFERALVAAPGTESVLDIAGDLAGVRTVLALVGPEGGWTEAELSGLTDKGCKPISLGPHILRIETAAVAVAAVMHFISP
jgi:16S rRNA (uracil1498-N3)-methyltransferase